MTFDIQARSLDSGVEILSLTVYDRHPDDDGRAIDGGFYGGIGTAVRDCGFVRSWPALSAGKDDHLDDHPPVYVFGDSTRVGTGAFTLTPFIPPEFYL